MNDLISRKALIAEYDRVHIGPPGGARKLMEDAPAVDVVVHGYWDDSGRYQFVGGKKAIVCSNCDCALTEEEYYPNHWFYCPVCGAKMDEEREDHENRRNPSV